MATEVVAEGTRPIRSNTVAASAVSEYEYIIDTLIEHYTRLDREAELLPLFSAMPLLRILWGYLKFTIALVGDMYLIIPINAVILIRNIFPGRWHYKSWSCKYFRAVGLWFWSGESSIILLQIRPLTVFFLHWHFRSRLSTLHHYLLLETAFSEDRAKAAIAKIDRAKAFWGQSSFASIILTWIIPLLGPLIEVIKLVVPLSLPQWGSSVAILSFGYILNFPVSAFMAKRGLMLDGSGSAALYPGLLSGSGQYGRERDLFSSLGIKVFEFPVDITLLILGAIVTFITYRLQIQLYGFLNNSAQWSPETYVLIGRAIGTPLSVALIIIVWLRRQRLGRL